MFQERKFEKHLVVDAQAQDRTEMKAASQSTVFWLFGRGASMECGLTWTVPVCWATIPRPARVERIKAQMRAEMDRAGVCGEPYRRLLELLRDGTPPGWRHRFLTTNWDYLLQRETLGLLSDVLPDWLDDSHVSHMNGTIEVLDDNANRSPFLLEDDPPSQRTWSVEANVAYNEMICGRNFVVIGVSFECDTDRFLLKALGDAQDMIIGQSTWIVVNRDDVALKKVNGAIKNRLPSATIELVKREFGEWLSEGMPDLQSRGIIACWCAVTCVGVVTFASTYSPSGFLLLARWDRDIVGQEIEQ